MSIQQRHSKPSMVRPPKHTLGCESTASIRIPAVQVCARVRPLLHGEAEQGQALDYKAGRGDTVTVRYAEASKEKQFRFDTVLGPDADQDAVWEYARLNSLMEQLVAGFHVTVFAYG